MKKLLIFIFLLPLCLTAQPEFSFDLYFEDALGNRDTITLGYDPLATDSIDVLFGEENIINQPWDSVLDVRIGLGHFLSSGTTSTPTFETLKQTKKQISHPYCESNYYNAYKFVVQIKNGVFPIKLTWNKDNFDSLCTSTNFITDWYPGCWFDCLINGNEQEPKYFTNSDSLILDYTSLVNSYNSDNTNLLFVSMSNGEDNANTINLIDENMSLNIFPNPVSNSLRLSSMKKIDSIEIFNVEGTRIDYTSNTGESTIEINTEYFTIGVYLLKIKIGLTTINYKLIKN